MYAKLIRAWLDVAGAEARTILEGMVEQRAQLGLAPVERWRLGSPIEIVPVIAVGTPVVGENVLQRFACVRDALSARGDVLQGLQLWGIDKGGNVTRTQAANLSELA